MFYIKLNFKLTVSKSKALQSVVEKRVEKQVNLDSIAIRQIGITTVRVACILALLIRELLKIIAGM